MHVITSFGLVFLTQKFSHWGVYLLSIPGTLTFLWGVRYFENLEKEDLSISMLQDGEIKDIIWEERAA